MVVEEFATASSAGTVSPEHRHSYAPYPRARMARHSVSRGSPHHKILRIRRPLCQAVRKFTEGRRAGTGAWAIGGISEGPAKPVEGMLSLVGEQVENNKHNWGSAGMSFRYIGSKTRVVEAIIKMLERPMVEFLLMRSSGTGAVAEAASRAGWPVHVNDHLFSSAIISLARVTSSAQARFENVGGYQNAIRALNASKSRRGFIWKEYSPASSRSLRH